MYAFLSESTFYICLDVSEIFGRNRCNIWSLSDCNRTRTHNILVCKRTLKHLAKLAIWLSCFVSSYLYSAFDCMFLLSGVRILEWIHTLYFAECQGTPCWKQARYLKFKWLKWDSNPTPVSLYTNTLPFGQTCQMIELFWKYLSLWCIWLCVLVMSGTHFRVNPHFIWIDTLMWIQFEMRTWHEKNIQSKAPYTKVLKNSSIVWPNGWVFVWELSGCGFESRCSNLNFRYCASFEQVVPWHSGKYRVWIHSGMRTWHDKNIQSNTPFR